MQKNSRLDKKGVVRTKTAPGLCWDGKAIRSGILSFRIYYITNTNKCAGLLSGVDLINYSLPKTGDNSKADFSTIEQLTTKTSR